MITTVPETPQPDLPNDGNEQTFESFAATMPETASGFLDAALPSPVNESVGDAGFLDGGDVMPSDAAARPRKRVDISKKMRKAMNKFRGKVANVPIMWFHSQAKGNPEWELDDEEKELLTDAIETVFEVLDIGVEIEPLSMTLTSIWWVIGYPVLAFTFLFLTKKSLTLEKEQTVVTESQP